MASEIEICNLALAHLGDSATVASIDPPEGSAQAEHCARFYPIARDSLLEMHDWAFATTRAALAAVEYTPGQWSYAYAYPADALRILAVLPAQSLQVYEFGNFNRYDYVWDVIAPDSFTTETDNAGRQIILANQVGGVVRYTRKVIDTGRFSPLFTDTLARYLASYLAGPLLKGDSGIAQSKQQLQIAMAMVARAALSDTNQRRQSVNHTAPWMAAR